MHDPKPRFTGIFIPAEILQRQDLTSTDVMLLSWIDALQCPERGGCFASNEYFATKLHLKENTVKVLISKLVDLGLIERISFDGRTRILRSCKEKWFGKSESTSGVDYNQPLGLNKINPCPSLESTPSYIYSKEQRKGVINNNNNTTYDSTSDPPNPTVVVVPPTKGDRVLKKPKLPMTVEEVFSYCVMKKLDWTAEEIREAYKILDDYKDPISSLPALLAGIINNLRKKELSCRITQKTNQKHNKAKRDSNETLSTCKTNCSEPSMPAPALVEFERQLKLPKK